MEKVNELIEKLADHIIGIINTSSEDAHEITEKTSALAKLIEAQHERPVNSHNIIILCDSLSDEELLKIAKEQKENFEKISKGCL